MDGRERHRPPGRVPGRTALAVSLCGPEHAAIVHALTQSAFREYAGVLDPPSGAMRETEESVRRDLVAHGGAIAWIDREAVGCLRFEVEPDHLHVRRVAVLPERQRQGLGTELMMWAHSHALSLGLHEVRLGVRKQLAGNQAFYKRLGYRVVARHHHPGKREVTWYEMGLRL